MNGTDLIPMSINTGQLSGKHKTPKGFIGLGFTKEVKMERLATDQITRSRVCSLWSCSHQEHSVPSHWHRVQKQKTKRSQGEGAIHLPLTKNGGMEIPLSILLLLLGFFAGLLGRCGLLLLVDNQACPALLFVPLETS